MTAIFPRWESGLCSLLTCAPYAEVCHPNLQSLYGDSMFVPFIQLLSFAIEMENFYSRAPTH